MEVERRMGMNPLIRITARNQVVEVGESELAIVADLENEPMTEEGRRDYRTITDFLGVSGYSFTG